MKSTMPWTRACSRRFSTPFSRQERSTSRFLPPPESVAANSVSRSVASGRRLKMRSSTRTSSSSGISSYTWIIPAFTIPMSMPARMAWKRKAEWIASRTTLLPRKLKDRLLTPPEILAPGQTSLMRRVAPMKATA